MTPSLAFDPFEPFAYAFFQRGLVVALVAGALCGLVGVYVVLRSMSYVGHGLSHAVFGGAAMSAALGASWSCLPHSGRSRALENDSTMEHAPVPH